jgi:hypothetical protein
MLKYFRISRNHQHKQKQQQQQQQKQQKKGNNKALPTLVPTLVLASSAQNIGAVQTPNSKPWFDAPESNEEEATQNNNKNENTTQTTKTTTTIMSKDR